jgi:hypothetical protein
VISAFTPIGLELGLDDFGDALELGAVLRPELHRQRLAALGADAAGAHDPAGLVQQLLGAVGVVADVELRVDLGFLQLN